MSRFCSGSPVAPACRYAARAMWPRSMYVAHGPWVAAGRPADVYGSVGSARDRTRPSAGTTGRFSRARLRVSSRSCQSEEQSASAASEAANRCNIIIVSSCSLRGRSGPAKGRSPESTTMFLQDSGRRCAASGMEPSSPASRRSGVGQRGPTQP